MFWHYVLVLLGALFNPFVYLFGGLAYTSIYWVFMAKPFRGKVLMRDGRKQIVLFPAARPLLPDVADTQDMTVSNAVAWTMLAWPFEVLAWLVMLILLVVLGLPALIIHGVIDGIKLIFTWSIVRIFAPNEYKRVVAKLVADQLITEDETK